MVFPQQFLNELKTHIALPDLISSYIKLERNGREYKGLCPFHKEKTPSFHVVEHKDFFHCFGCGAHGDIVGFTMRIENLNFLDAIERLALRAGLDMPAYDKQKTEEIKKQKYDEYAICHAAADIFSAYLYTPSGKDALEYLYQRGINDDVIARFHIGYCDNNISIKEKLQDIYDNDRKLIDLGLLRKDSPQYYRNFFNKRIIIPITDRQGRYIAFGGRIVPIYDHGKSPKYINSPETTIFQKGKTLYNIYHARQAAINEPVIIAEGYMDVIALVEAGFNASIAPLGTALGEDQISLIWRMADVAYICLDGDNAGKKAALRAAERALNVLRAGKTLFFIFLPQNEDPDSFIKKSGVVAFDKLRDNAQSLESFLFDSMIDECGVERPDQQALLDKKIEFYTTQIKDNHIKKRYRDDWRHRLYNLLYDRKKYSASYKKKTQTNHQSLIGMGNKIHYQRQKKILQDLYHHPQLIGEFCEALAMIEFFADLQPAAQALIDLYYQALHNQEDIKIQNINNKQLNILLQSPISSYNLLDTMIASDIGQARQDTLEFIQFEFEKQNKPYLDETRKKNLDNDNTILTDRQ